MTKKEITFVIKVMSGGGAERVISILSKAFVQRNFDVSLILTHQKKAEADLSCIDSKVKVVTLEDDVVEKYENIKKIKMLKARLVGKINHILGRSEDAYLIKKYEIRNYGKVKLLKKYFSEHSESIVIPFLNDSIFLTLLSAKYRNRIIISDRSDPEQSMASKTNIAFFKSMYPKANNMVFQSSDVMKWYNKNLGITGRVVFNPLKPALPEKYNGIRKKKIVNFCRISKEKNLALLVNAFARFNSDFPEYELYIYGDAVGNGVDGYIESIYNIIDKLDCKDKIHLLPAQKDIHNLIKDYAMFVSSSDFEGMSNSMIEAMAIGLPTICTDCPAGGARAIIKDHENGLLVPVNDVDAMYKAMKEIAENEELAEKISLNGTKLEEELSVDKIVNQWLEMIK